VAARRIKPIELALQGGGAHGAFTWGVLDRLLEDERLEIVGISGTSAGAMNAVVLADGLMRGGRQGARGRLAHFWRKVSGAAPGDVFSAFFGNFSVAGSPLAWYLDWLGRAFSPYQLNPLDINPLRDILAAEVDFERVRACDKVKLFVSATNVRTGKLKEFRQHELSADAVLASAALPMVFRAVEIDGEAYWDGGYLGNPSLLPLVADSPAHDLVLVQINPIHRDSVPTTAQEILDRLNEITFNSSLVKELRTLALIQQLLREEGAPPPGGRASLFAQIEALRMHRIAAEAELARLGAGSKMNTAWTFLRRLHNIGRAAADDWLERNFTHVGRRSTLELAAFLR
jgi:NTE family protein